MRVEAIPPEEAAALAVLAHAMLQNARPTKAATLLEALDALAPGQPPTLRALALAQVRSQKPERALRTLDRLAAAGGADAVHHLLRAQALEALQRPLEARLAMKAFLQSRQPAPQTPTDTAEPAERAPA